MFGVDDEGVDFLLPSGVFFDSEVDDLHRCNERPTSNIPDTVHQKSAIIKPSIVTWSSYIRRNCVMADNSQSNTATPLGIRPRQSHIRFKRRHRRLDNAISPTASPSTSRKSMSIVGTGLHWKRRRGIDFRRNGAETGSGFRRIAEPKNALMQLNELRPRDSAAANVIKFKQIIRSGPDHSPTYTAIMDYNGQTYTGVGHTKKIAKQMAAERAIHTLVQFRRESAAVGQLDLATKSAVVARHHPSRKPNVVQDFTSDDTEGIAVLFHRFDELASDGDSGCQSPSSPSIDEDEDENGGVKLNLQRRRCRRNHDEDIADRCSIASRIQSYTNPCSSVARPPAGLRSNPVAILNDLLPSIEYRVISRDEVTAGVERTAASAVPCGPPKRLACGFVVSITVDGRQFIGSGRTKRSAKRRAATEALRNVFLLRHLV